jgi:hypothetical protein
VSWRGIRYYGRTGTLTINSIVLNSRAWDIPDLTALWADMDVDGDDVSLPGADGVVPHQRFLSAMRVPLPMVISGDCDPAGVDYANAWVGLETNLATLKSGLLLPTGTGDGTLPATLTMPSGATRTADVHVLGLRHGASQGTVTLHARMRAVLQLSIPAGQFA